MEEWEYSIFFLLLKMTTESWINRGKWGEREVRGVTLIIMSWVTSLTLLEHLKQDEQ